MHLELHPDALDAELVSYDARPPASSILIYIPRLDMNVVIIIMYSYVTLTIDA
jgi:hypothetical protein